MFACSSDDTGSAKRGVVGRDQDASTSRSNDKGGSTDAGSPELAMRDAGRGGEGGNASTDTQKGASSNTKHSSDAGTTQRHNDDDAGMHMPSDSTHMPDDDAGTNLPDTENCCIPHAKPGCNDADIQQCVCDKLDACCTQAWTAACTYIVTERYCQPGVRDCVCGSGDGQWQQSTCCDADWTSTCDDVAQIKCGASVGCK